MGYDEKSRGGMTLLEPDRMVSRGDEEKRDFDEPSKVQHYLEAHGHELQKLRETIGMLYDRIEPVLGPERAEKVPSDSDAIPERSEVVRVIIDQTSLLRSLHRRLMENIQRIEL